MFSLIWLFCPKRLQFVISLLLVLTFTDVKSEQPFEIYPLCYTEKEIPYFSPTNRFIQAHGWEKISSGLKNLGVSMVHRNLFDRIWHREERGFIGYHGSTQEYRIYQDIIKIVLEEIIGLISPKTFIFWISLASVNNIFIN